MGHADIRIVTESSVASEATLGVVLGTLRAFNRAASPAYFALRDLPSNAPRPLHVIAYAADGSIVGGLMATTCLAWLDIDIMSVREGGRRRGVGRRLMRAAEAEAVARGCRYASVDTMEYQAPGFYTRLGYTIVGRFADRDGQGHAKVFLTRTLPGADGAERAPDAAVDAPVAPIDIVRVTAGHIALAERAVRDVHGRKDADPSALARFLADAATLMLVAVDGDDVVGSVYGHLLAAPHRPEPRCLLYEFDVRPRWRRRGIGAALVRAFVDAARDAGAFSVWLVTNASNDAAMATYRRCGFERRHADDVMWSVVLD
jgi:ribosomal protein S18 acetylase RimI-like enzyme